MAFSGKFWFGARAICADGGAGVSGAVLLSALHKAARGCEGLDLQSAVRAMLSCGWGATTTSYLMHTVLSEDVLMGAPGYVSRLVRDGLAALGCADRGDAEGATELLGRVCQHLEHCRRSRLPAAVMSLALFDTPLVCDWNVAINRLTEFLAAADLSGAAHALQSALLLVGVDVCADVGAGRVRRLTKFEKSQRIFQALVDDAPAELAKPLTDLFGLSEHFRHERPLIFFAALCLRAGRGLLSDEDWQTVPEEAYADGERWTAAALLEPIDLRSYVDGLPPLVFDKHTSHGGSYQQFLTGGATPAERYRPSATLWQATVNRVQLDRECRAAYETTAGKNQSKSAKRLAALTAVLAEKMGQEPRGKKRKAKPLDRPAKKIKA